MTVVQFIMPIVSLAIDNSIIRFSMSRETDPGVVLKSTMPIAFVANFILIAIALGLNWYPDLASWAWSFWLVALLNILRSWFSLYSQGTQQTTIFAQDNVLFNIYLVTCSVLFLYLFEWHLNGYFLAFIIADVLSILYLAFRLHLFATLARSSINRQLLREMLIYSAPLVLNSISWGIASMIDKSMIAAYYSLADTGIYSAASKIPSLLNLFTGVFTQAWGLSMISDYESERDTRFYENVFSYMHIVTLSAVIFVLILNNTIIPLILGDDFAQAAVYSPILLLGTYFLTYAGFCTSIYSAMKLSKQIMYSSVGGTVINVILNVLLIPSFGIMGACIATCASCLYIASYRMINSRKYLPLHLEYRKLILSVGLVSVYAFLVALDIGALYGGLVVFAGMILLYRRDYQFLYRKVRGSELIRRG